MTTTTPRPPIVRTHRKPGRITSTDVLDARRRFAEHKPTHRGEPRPALEELRAVNANLARTHT